MPNRLIDTASPYLIQHAHNPVDWYPWCDDAFEEARRRDVPVFLSIGYATCHWCHVMAHESFEDDEAAEAINRHFVAVKVDREERPDIDSQYMAVCQVLGRHCGWPLTVLMTPEGLPFYVATYIPKTGRFGRPGLLDLIDRVHTLWSTDRDRVTASAHEVADLVRHNEHLPAPEDPAPDVIRRAAGSLMARFDPAHAGFGTAPKFPAAHNLIFLMRFGRYQGDARAPRMAVATLEAMGRSGLFDQVGGGFHRYSTDAEWRLPHFEKMLYDQAWLLMAYAEGFLATGDGFLRQVGLRTAEYVLRDLRSADGAFFSGEDADSEGQEGRFYLWSMTELESVLAPDELDLLVSRFDVQREGNFADEATGRLSGLNVLHAGLRGDHKGPITDRWNGIRFMDESVRRVLQKLSETRSTRVRPQRDDKILTDWNGLMIGALAVAGRAFGLQDLIAAAVQAADTVDRLHGRADGGVMHASRKGRTSVEGLLDDYAALAWGHLECYQATGSARHLDRSVHLADEMRKRFSSGNGGFWHVQNSAEPVLTRQQPYSDGAMPSGSALALDLLVRLGRLTGQSEHDDAADRLARAAGALVNASPGAMTGFLLGLGQATVQPLEIVLVGTTGEETFDAMSQTVDGLYVPHAVIVRKTAGTDDLYNGSMVLPPGAKAAAYVCRNRVCERPVTTADELRRLLA